MQLLSDDTPLFLALPLLGEHSRRGRLPVASPGERKGQKNKNHLIFSNPQPLREHGETEGCHGGYQTWQHDDRGRSINATSLSATPQRFGTAAAKTAGELALA